MYVKQHRQGKGDPQTWDAEEHLQFQQGEQRLCITAKSRHAQRPAPGEDFLATVSQRQPCLYQQPLAREDRLSARAAWISASTSASVSGGSAAKRSAASNNWATRRRLTFSRSSVSNAYDVSRPLASASRTNEPGNFSLSSNSTEFSSVVMEISHAVLQLD
jgi:hypothetical protein